MFLSPNNTAYNSIVCIDNQQTKVPLVICFAYSRANAIDFLYRDVSSDKWNRRVMHYAKQCYSITLCPNIPLRYYKVICSLWDRWDLSILNLCFDFVYFKRHFKNDTKSGCVVTLIQITFSYWQQSYRVCLINATNGYIQEMPMIPIRNIKMGTTFCILYPLHHHGSSLSIHVTTCDSDIRLFSVVILNNLFIKQSICRLFEKCCSWDAILYPMTQIIGSITFSFVD